VSYALIRATRDVRLNLAAFASESGTHPELIRRLVALGLLEAHQDPTGELWFSRNELAALGRVQRLRAGFALNYAAIGLVTELLDRISTLEATLRTASTAPEGRPTGTAGQPARRPGR
jgi:chaperone modulatory protein CbpM